MTTPKTLGEQLAIAGAATAAAHAGDDWVSSAIAHYKAFLSSPTARILGRFQTAHVRIYAEENGLPPPPDARAWGAIARSLKSAGLIRSVGVGRSIAPRQHYGLCTEWEAV